MTRILIVDDKEENLAYLQALLTSRQCTIECASHGAEALLKARLTPPDVVISDLLMPVMDGYTLLRHWKADALLNAIPFIVYTATYVDPEDERLALNLGADAFILKPSDPEHLIARLREVQANAASFRPVPPRIAAENQEAQLKLYNDALIRKLEEKTLQLEAANRALQRDVAARENAELVQRRMAETQMAILNALPAHIALVDARGTIVSVNEAWRRFATANVLQGPEFGVGQDYLAVCEQAVGDCSAEAKEAAAGIRGVLSGETKTFTIEYPCHSPTEQHWYRLMVTPLDERHRSGAVIMHVNITERKQAEEALRASEVELRTLTEAMPQIVWVTRPDGWHVHFNQHWMDYTGLTLQESLGQGWNPPFHPEDRPRAAARWQQATESGEPYEIEYRLRRADGIYRWMLGRALPLRDSAGRVVKWFGTCTDIHDVKQAELDVSNANQALRASEEKFRRLNAELEARVLERTQELNQSRIEADAANHAKSAFLATMSHEIRTPMNGVIGMVDVLHQTSLRGDQVEMVDLIRDSAYSLLEIIDDILDFSKIEAGRMEIESGRLCLADLVESVCGMLDHTAIKRDVRMALFVDPAIPSLLVGDEARLRQVLVNLVGNAIKFCGGREWPGRVAVRARLRDCDADAATVEMSVADDGIGMDEPTLARLFTPFTQGDVSTTRRFGGTGLGLAISGTLVKLMGGQISVRSVLGQGATFTVVLTLARAEGEAAADPAAALVAGLRCCVIGNDAPLADDLMAYLSCAGVAVEHAAEPSAAGAAPVWLLLPSQSGTSIDTLREFATRAGNPQPRFLSLGSGYRRRPRVEADDLVLLDHCGLTRRSLYRVLALASGRSTIDPAAAELDERPPPAARHAEPRDLLPSSRQILVAEDNETNRKVIHQQMHLVGFDAEFAVDGQDALERWRSGDFPLVFTDLNMPRMDGYALAAAIRAEEQAKGGRRTAIVALTANALRDEELRCRAAGMDAYLSKPVRLARLQAAVEEWLPLDSEVTVNTGAGVGPFGKFPTEDPASAPLVDLAVLKALIGDNEAVVSDVLHAFRISAAECDAELSKAYAGEDLPGVANAAHKLKAGALSIGALQLGQRCNALEVAALARQPAAVAALIPLYDADLRAVFQSLKDH